MSTTDIGKEFIDPVFGEHRHLLSRPAPTSRGLSGLILVQIIRVGSLRDALAQRLSSAARDADHARRAYEHGHIPDIQASATDATELAARLSEARDALNSTVTAAYQILSSTAPDNPEAT